MEKSIDSRQNGAPTQGGEWLPLREASRQMGVSAATLRSWADEGRVPSYRTPGGHRRFKVDAVGLAGQGARSGGDSRWRLLEYSTLGHIRVALEVWARERGELLEAPTRARLEHRTLGRELVQLLVTALQQARTPPQEQTARLGQRYAKLHRRYSVKLRTALTLLGFFRRAFVTSVIEFGFGLGDPEPQQLIVWLERVNEILDDIGVAMVVSMVEES